MLQDKVTLSGFGAPEKDARLRWDEWVPVRIKGPGTIRSGVRSRFRRWARRVLRPYRDEGHPVKQGARWTDYYPTKEQRFQVIDAEGGVIDTWRLRASIARFERGEGERVDLDAVRERFGLPPGE